MKFEINRTSIVKVTFDNNHFVYVDFNKIYRNIDFSNRNSSPVRSLVAQIDSDCFRSKAYGVTFTERYGITPTNLLKLIRGHVYHEYIKPVEKYVNVLGRGYNRGTIKWHVVQALHRRKDMIQQLESDNLHHLVPLVLLVPKDEQPTQYLRKKYGKSVWKQLCKNTITRNSLIVKTNMKHSRAIEYSVHLPSTYLKYGRSFEGVFMLQSYNRNVFQEVLNSCKVSTKEGRNSLVLKASVYYDTVRMYRDLHGISQVDAVQRLSKIKTYKRIHELHEQYTQEIELRKDKDAKLPFHWLNEYNLQGSVDTYDYIIYNTIADIKTEGKVMKHCVGSYADRVKKGDYLVVSIRKNGERFSTLGLMRNGDKWVKQQHYGVCNSIVDDNVAQKVIKVINEVGIK